MIFLATAGWSLLVLFSVQVMMTLKAHAGWPLRAIGRMTAISFRGRKRFLLIAAVLVLVASVLQPLLPLWIPPLPQPLLVGLSLVSLGGCCLPPLVVYLGASGNPGHQLVSRLWRQIAPFRFTHLLLTSQVGRPVPEDAVMTGYRVGGDWESAVRALCRMVPLLIVDLRVLTDAVVREVSDLLLSGQHFKVIFVTDEKGHCAPHYHLDDEDPGSLCIMKASALPAVLSGMGWSFLFSLCPYLIVFVASRMARYPPGAYDPRSEADALAELPCAWAREAQNAGTSAETVFAHVVGCLSCSRAVSDVWEKTSRHKRMAASGLRSVASGTQTPVDRGVESVVEAGGTLLRGLSELWRAVSGFFGSTGSERFRVSCATCRNKWMRREFPKGTPTEDDWLRMLLEDLTGDRGFVCTNCEELLCEGCFLRWRRRCPRCGEGSFRSVWLADRAATNRPLNRP